MAKSPGLFEGRFHRLPAYEPKPSVDRRPVIVLLDMHLPSAANMRDAHWGARQRRTKEQRGLARMMLSGRIAPPCHVLLMRLGPRPLDSDNLQAAFKSVRDGVADALGCKDNDERVTWEYTQLKHPSYQVRIEVIPATHVSSPSERGL